MVLVVYLCEEPGEELGRALLLLSGTGVAALTVSSLSLLALLALSGALLALTGLPLTGALLSLTLTGLALVSVSSVAATVVAAVATLLVLVLVLVLVASTGTSASGGSSGSGSGGGEKSLREALACCSERTKNGVRWIGDGERTRDSAGTLVATSGACGLVGGDGNREVLLVLEDLG